MPEPRKLSLPQLKRVELRNFSLYDRRRVISTDFNNGVFCLAGANGLGKSTFLAAVNFALTGVVANPERKFTSVEEYCKYSLDYAARYFDGRVNQADREIAEVALDFSIGRHNYHIARGLFEPVSLRSLSITSDVDPDNEYAVKDGTDPYREYRRQVVTDIGVGTFEQFVFLQLFLFTFDERRHLLAWDDTVAEQALYLAFGVDQEQALRTDNLRRDVERFDTATRARARSNRSEYAE